MFSGPENFPLPRTPTTRQLSCSKDHQDRGAIRRSRAVRPLYAWCDSLAVQKQCMPVCLDVHEMRREKTGQGSCAIIQHALLGYVRLGPEGYPTK